jgi:glycosyltransferase involved in cell wall biosynthesis
MKGSAIAPSVAILSLSTIAADPRVRRHVGALVADGWKVTTVGFGDAGDGQQWTHRSIPELPYERGILPRAGRICGLLASHALPGAALWTWRRQPRHQVLLRAVHDLEFDVVIACDHTSLPAAMVLADSAAAALVYDSHEFALGEKEENPVWRAIYPPYIRAIEEGGLRRAYDCITVSEGIATAIAQEYHLDRTPTVIRNLPGYHEMPYRPVREHLMVHHHGVLAPGRGLELLVASVAHWHPRFSLRLRGPADPDYLVKLRALINHNGVADRVTIARPLPMECLIADAWEADIGIYLLPDFGPQNRFSLPNKLFEFLMAGLAIITNDLPEMRRIVEAYGVGIVIADATIQGVATRINALHVGAVDAYKKAALAAARNLCWDNEKEHFLKLCRAALAHRNCCAKISNAPSAGILPSNLGRSNAESSNSAI